MTFNDFKAYRSALKPVFELKKWRSKLRKHSIGEIIGFTGVWLGVAALGMIAMAVCVRLFCLLIVAMPHAWLCVR